MANASETIRYEATDGKGRSNPAPFTVAVQQPAGTSTLTTDDNGGGSVSRDLDQTAYSNGTTVQLTANAFPGYQFYYWDGDVVSTNHPLSLAVNAATRVTAVFRPVPQLTSYALWAAAQDWPYPGVDGMTDNPEGFSEAVSSFALGDA